MSLNLRVIAEEAARSVAQYNALLKNSGALETMRRVAEEQQRIVEQMAPILRTIDTPSFRATMQQMQRAAEEVSRTLSATGVFDMPAIRAVEELYEAADAVAVEVAKEERVPEEKREAVITRPLFRETTLQIRRGLPSVREIRPLELPADAAWEMVQAEFHDDQHMVIEIPKYGIKKFVVGYEDMGMQDKRNGRPNAQWAILRNLAKYDGEISWTTPVASPQVKKQKQLLSKALRDFFQIDGDPFGVYQREKAYRLKMLLFADRTADIGEKKSEAQEYFDDHTGEAYDPYEDQL